MSLTFPRNGVRDLMQEAVFNGGQRIQFAEVNGELDSSAAMPAQSTRPLSSVEPERPCFEAMTRHQSHCQLADRIERRRSSIPFRNFDGLRHSTDSWYAKVMFDGCDAIA